MDLFHLLEESVNLKKLSSAIILFIISILIFSCSGGGMSEEIIKFPSIKDIQDAKWENLAQKKIYFGHQSVGFNIIEGIEDLMKENPQIKLNIVKTNDPSDFAVDLFAHSGVGKNGYPESKIDEFAKFINEGIGNKADIVFFKFCYVDVRTDSDVEDVFSYYKNTMTKLINAYPDTKFVIFTVPLTTEPTVIQSLFNNAKKAIKKIMRKPVWGPPPGNQQRSQLNEMLRQEYNGKAPIFDIAMIESTYPDGTYCSFDVDGKTYYSLVPEYTDDGGHLNEIGRKRAAEQLIVLLADLS